MELLTLIAILAGPAIGAKIALRMEDRRQKRQQQIDVLASLLRTSQGTARLSAEHVGALNLIQLVFHEEKPVLDAYERYIKFLKTPPLDEREGRERLLDLLAALTKALGYPFNKTDLENSSYAPQGWDDVSITQQDNMILLAKLLRGESYLRVAAVTPTSQTENSSARPPVRP